MKKQKIYMTALLLGVCLLSGCSKDSKLQVVVKKETPEGTVSSEDRSESIQEQVQAPETLNTILKFPEMAVEINARVVVPDVTGIRQKKVESRIWQDEDFELMEEELFQGGEVYDEIIEENERADVPEKKEELEIEEQNNKMSTEMEVLPQPEKTEKKMETAELIQKAGKAVESIFSREEPVSLEEINGWKSLLFTAKETIRDPKERRKAELLCIIADGADYFLEAPVRKTSLQEMKEAAGAVVFRDHRIYSLYMLKEYQEYETPMIEICDPYVDNFYQAENALSEGEKVESISTKEAIKEGTKLLNQLGMKDMTLEQAEKTCLYFYQDQDLENWRMEEAVRLEFIKNVEGIPVNYGEIEPIPNIDQTGMSNWPCEKVNMTISKSGLSDFSWQCPEIVEEWQEENAFLLPFSEIEKIFGEMIESHFTEQMLYYGEWISGMNLQIEEIRLGYSQVASTTGTGNETNRNKGEDGQITYSGILVPAWSFIGRVVSAKEPEYQSDRMAVMVINAMDGSIIKK